MAQPVKRVLVNPDNPDEVVPDTKRSRIELNPSQRSKVLCYIHRAARALYDALKCTTPCYNNINVNIQIANLLFACHNILRMRQQQQTLGNADKKSEKQGFKVNIGGRQHTIEKEAALRIVNKAATDSGLEFKSFREKDPTNWYGVAGPYIDFFCAFGYRKVELRMGHRELTIQKETGKAEKKISVSNYGLLPKHHILLEGISFPPEKRASMAQSVGCMTALLCYIRTPEKFRPKWKDACLRAFSHIPFIKDLMAVVLGKSASESQSLITLFADLILIVGSRRAHRVFFPILLFCRATGVEDPESTSHPIGVPDVEAIANINFSGAGAFLLYAKICAANPLVTMYGNYTASQAAQVVYHSMFGTYKEDLNVLSTITSNATWNTRSEFAQCFQKEGESENLVEFNLIKQNYYSKLAGANMTRVFSGSNTQLSYIATFSGRRTQKFSNEFITNIGKGMGMSVGMRTMDDLQRVIRKVLSDTLEMIRKAGNTIDIGTTGWRKVENIGTNNQDIEYPLNFPAVHKFFLGGSSNDEEL